jgi:CBS domain-containing membrane protein
MSTLKVADIMSKPAVVLEQFDDLDMAETMMSLERIRHLPVVDSAGSVLGLVSHGDLLRAQTSHLERLSRSERRAENLQITVAEIMTDELQTIEPDATLLKAAQLMNELKIGCLPVVADRLLVGMLTESDLVKLLIRELSDPTL